MSEAAPSDEPPIRLGISSCLLGNPVRYDGGHKRDPFLTELLGRFVEWVPVCPELEVGMGVPRPVLRLEREGDTLRLVEIASGRDHTRRMQRYAAQRVRALRRADLCGYVLKRGSPSCGMQRVQVQGDEGVPKRDGQGLFAATLRRAYPNLPIEEEGRLNDARLRENFIERVFAYRRVRGLFRGRWTTGRVVAFHAAHELQLMAHAPAAYGELGRLVASLRRRPRAAVRERYEAGFMGALARPASRGRNATVLQHAAGHLKGKLDSDSRAELADRIREYRQGRVPLLVPVTLLRHHVRRHAVDRLAGQVFLEPHPVELMLRNHV